MLKSAQDTFSDKQVLGAMTAGQASTSVYSEVLDFNQHGDDLGYNLFLVVQAATPMVSVASKPSNFGVAWETSDTADFAAPAVLQTWGPFTDAGMTRGAFIVKNAPLPRGMKRYNRLKYTVTAHENAGTKTYPSSVPELSAFVIDGRQEPLD